jgi:hypothetical protein
MRSLWILAILLVWSSARANPVMVGAGLGLTQSEANSTSDADHALALFGRLGLSRTLAVQVDVSKISGQDPNTDTRSATGSIVLDLARGGRAVPILVGGAGFDRETTTGTGVIDAHHFEAGLGLEYRSPDGFVLGADFRIGDRTVDSNSTLVPLACCTLWSYPQTLTDGQYRTARVTLGVRF